MEEAETQLTREMFALLPPDHPAHELMAQFGLLDQVGSVLRIGSTGSGLPDGEGQDDKPVTLAAAAENLLNGYEQTGELPLLNRAIGMLQAMLGAGQPLDTADRHQATHALGTALWSLFERTGDRATFDEGISLLDAAASMPGAPGAQRLKSRKGHMGPGRRHFAFGRGHGPGQA